MSQRLAIAEMERFLSGSAPEVLSISGRWGVGKTYAWDEVLKARRATAGLRHYAYVSVFGLRSLDALKTAIVQSTIGLDGNALEPTVESFVEHMSSIKGIRKMGGEVARRSLQVATKGAAAVPYAGKVADLIAPGAALLIRNQIICIDDIERAGQGLDVTDILGLVSSLRERRGCKIVLLLNEDGLGKQAATYRAYLEKVVDQAVRFEPTAEESAAAAIGDGDPLGSRLGRRTSELGITNIRVIRRIRRFLGHVEQALKGLHDGVTDAVLHSMALLGWCVFEPGQAPDIERVRRFRRFSGMFGEDKRPAEEKRVDEALLAYGFQHFDDTDDLLLAGISSGAFDGVALRAEFEKLDAKLQQGEVRAAIAHPWNIYASSFDDDCGVFLDALVSSLELHGGSMNPAEASDAIEFLREFGRAGEADRLVKVYVDAQVDRPREFFAASHGGYLRAPDAAILAAFEARLAGMPLERDPATILLDIADKQGWNPADVAYLATVPVDEYRAVIKRLRSPDLGRAIAVAMQFAQIQPANANDLEVSRRMARALRLVAAENPLNAMRVKPHLKGLGAMEEEEENDLASADAVQPFPSEAGPNDTDSA